ncbi:TRAP transporter large permease subunit [Pseudoroseomonas ludipueritiae]|uniref:TRAP transporter large permease subunit n=1 Tax=Pseudoroseomonas ludipueritiae TaxID=198093 RepID=UPI0019338702|nr:TRAP transporter large permease subunit [Roseomonas sp. ACRSG]
MNCSRCFKKFGLVALGWWDNGTRHTTSSKRLLAPIFVPLAQQIGLDPLQLGLMMVLNLGIGLYTPPVGTTLFISSSIAGSSMGETVRALWPFFFVAIGLLLAVSYVPALTIRF